MIKDLYLELSGKLSEIEQVKWIDLWTNQVNFLDTELPFPAPAIFLAFRSESMSELSNLQQDVDMSVAVYVYYETFADSFHESFNQSTALEFSDMLIEVHTKIHGSTGTSYSNMNRISLQPIDVIGAGILYQMIFTCNTIDKTASPECAETTSDLTILNEAGPYTPPQNIYILE